MFNNPLAEARWLRFKANKRGFISPLDIYHLVWLDLYSLKDRIANDKPLLVSYDNHWFCSCISEYAETEFGGELKPKPTTKTHMLSELVKTAVVGVAVIPFNLRHDKLRCFGCGAIGPDSVNWLGTDDGRDVLARIIYGFVFRCCWFIRR